jgi:hypothetical protein
MIIEKEIERDFLRALLKSPQFGLPEYMADPIVQRRVGRAVAEASTQPGLGPISALQRRQMQYARPLCAINIEGAHFLRNTSLSARYARARKLLDRAPRCNSAADVGFSADMMLSRHDAYVYYVYTA